MKTKKRKTAVKARITSVAVSRLYNLGNYQNVKYDLSAEVPPGASAKDTLVLLSHILAALKPIREPDCLRQLEEALKKHEADRSAWEKEHLDEWITERANHLARMDSRRRAIESLDNLGGSSTHKDAAEDWED